jgi:glycosyltransferase involved in cell wall biosynthesis
MTTYPRILFITSHAFNHVTGGGITFSNLFRDWPKDSIATVHNDPEPVSYDVCEQYYNIGDKEVSKAFPFKFLRRFTSPSSKNSTPEISPRIEQKSSLLRRLATIILGELIPEHGKLSPELAEWIDGFKPEVIYTILGSVGIMELIESVRIKYELPLVVHVMDDWLNVPGKGLLGPYQMYRLRKQARNFFDIASIRMGISEHMCNEYKRRYNVEFISFQNVIDVEEVERYQKKDLARKFPSKIVYIGSIFSNAQLESLIECCQAVANLNLDGQEINMTISSPSGHADRYYDKLAVHPAINIIKTIENDAEFFSVISEADLLLLPVNFDDESIKFIRYSMPTKVPAYLSIGTPILVYGPSDVAQVSYAKDYGWGIIQSVRGIENLEKTIMESLTDIDLRKKVSNVAVKVAHQYHDAKIVRKKFQETLSSISFNKNANI